MGHQTTTPLPRLVSDYRLGRRDYDESLVIGVHDVDENIEMRFHDAEKKVAD